MLFIANIAEQSYDQENPDCIYLVLERKLFILTKNLIRLIH